MPAVEDWVDAGAHLLRTEAAGAAALAASAVATDRAAAVTSDAALVPVDLQPFDAPERALWAFGRGMRTALGPDGASPVLEAAPRPGAAAPFSLGLAEGVADAVTAIVAENLHLVWSGMGALLDYYNLVLDLALWTELVRVWTAAEGTGLAEVTNDLAAHHPDLFRAMVAYRPLLQRLDGLAQALRDDSQASASPWTRGESAVADCMVALSVTIGRLARPILGQFVSARGDARTQGRLVGRVVARAVIEAALIAMGLYGLIRGAAGAAASVLVEVRAAVSTAELANVAAQADRLAGGVMGAGRAAAGAARDSQVIYAELADDIAAYSRLSRRTGAFNRSVRDIFGFTVADTGYIELQLDAHHIVESRWYGRFASELERVFGWTSADDMDAVALHTTFHIRSGSRLWADLGLVGAEGESSLTRNLQQFLNRAQTAADGSAQPFANLDQIFRAHAFFYRTNTSRLWPRLEAWFDAALARIAAAGPPPP